MEYLIFILLIVLLVLDWGTARDVDCIHKMLLECGLSPGEDKAVKRATEELDVAGKGVQKALDDAPK